MNVISFIPITNKSVFSKAPLKLIIDKTNMRMMKAIKMMPIHPSNLFLLVISIPPTFKTENKMNQLQAQEEELRRKMEFRTKKQKELERLREQNKKQKEKGHMNVKNDTKRFIMKKKKHTKRKIISYIILKKQA